MDPQVSISLYHNTKAIARSLWRGQNNRNPNLNLNGILFHATRPINNAAHPSLVTIILHNWYHQPMTRMRVLELREKTTTQPAQSSGWGTGCEQRSTGIQSSRLKSQHHVIHQHPGFQMKGSGWPEGLCMGLTWPLLTTDLRTALLISLHPTPMPACSLLHTCAPWFPLSWQRHLVFLSLASSASPIWPSQN